MLAKFRAVRCSGLVAVLTLAVAAVTPAGALAGKPSSKGNGNNGPKHSHGNPHTHSSRVGAVYTETNDLANNAVVVFDRYANGSLKQRQVVSSGGKGGSQTQPGCPSCTILDTQGELALTSNGKLLFAVNAGSNTISSFLETATGLKLVDQKSSGGVFPNSLTVRGHVLYTLNSNSLNISGFRFSSSGHMTPIPGSSVALTAGATPGLPRQISFDHTGKVLVVTLLGPPFIDTFVLGAGSVPGPGTAYPATTELPFGFAFDSHNRLVVSQISSMTGPGSAASYSLSNAGVLAPLSTQTSGGALPCWVSITNNGKYAFVVNTGGPAPSGATVGRLAIAPSGALSLLGTTPNLGEFAKTDPALSRDSKYLYVLAPSIVAGNTSRIDVYRVSQGGNLTLIESTPKELAVGASGLVAR
jgi:6-phosphogluconolactonase (cycloisomerase 2 family)